MRTATKTLLIITSLAAVIGAAGTASAETAWQRHHPRRVELNHRLANQHARIIDERREGDLSRGQARDLRAEDRGIRAQERFDASKHHGHLTRGEQRRLNREENAVSGQIGR